MFRVLPAALLAACSFTSGAYPDDGRTVTDDAVDSGSDGPEHDAAVDTVTSALRAKTITVTSTITGTHVDFPMWVVLDDTDLASRAQADGADIHFTTTTGTPLDYERQDWTKTGGHLEAWVRVPAMQTGAQIQVRYGELAAAHAASAPNVFATYTAVWHLEDSLASPTIAEARGVATGTAANLTTTARTTAKLGFGIDFTSNSDQITFTNSLTGAGAHTISLWVDQRTTTNNDALVVLGDGQTNKARWFHSRFNAATMAVGFYGNDWNNPAEDIQGDSWTLLHWVFDGASRNSRLYRDGTLIAGPFQHATGIDTQGTAGYIGNVPASAMFGTNMGAAATLDEVRIIGIARDANWIAAEAANQTLPASFYTVGAELTP